MMCLAIRQEKLAQQLGTLIDMQTFKEKLIGNKERLNHVTSTKEHKKQKLFNNTQLNLIVVSKLFYITQKNATRSL